MSVLRRQRWLGSQRIDVPHLRSIESAMSSDFDTLISGTFTGNKSYVVTGFEINQNGAIGAAATGLQLLVASSTVLHTTSRHSGTFYTVPSTALPEVLNPSTNTKVRGTFVPNAINYIGLEYERVADTSTSDTVYFWNPANKTEFSSNVPLATVLKYTIVISTSVFAANVLPLARVIVDVAGNVTEVSDQRDLFYRLGTAGSEAPNPSYVYPWTNHSEGRVENPSSSNSSLLNPFRGGDKQIRSMKEWMNAIMSSLKEIKGTTFWYSENVGGSLTKLRQDLGNTVITGRGNISHSNTVAGRINWSQDIYVSLIGSRLSYRINANASSSDITLSDGQVAYIDLVRGVNITPNLIFTNGSAVVASVGSVAWTGLLQAGDWIKLVIDDDTEYYQIQSVDSLSQVTLTSVWGGTSTGVLGAKAQYAFGVYETNPAPSTDRHVKIAAKKDVPFNEDVFWFLYRADNSGSIPRIYVRFLGSELEQGEDREISDTISEQLIQYIGAARESDAYPEYSNKLGDIVTEVFTVTTPAAAGITSGQYFTINSALDEREYYVWYNKDGAGGNPEIVGKTPIEVAISTGDTANQVAAATQAAIDASLDFDAVVALNVVTVTLSAAGDTTDAANVNVVGLTVSVTAQGDGAPNHYVSDGDNLTLSIKKLDRNLKLLAGTESPLYEETLTVVTGPASNDNEVAGPISASTNIKLPYDSRDLNAINGYVVGKGDLEVYLNGQRVYLGKDYNEVGSSGDESVTIEILQNLVVNDEVLFRIDPAKRSSVGAGGTGEANTGANVGSGASVFRDKTGVQLNFRRLAAGAGISITQNANDITLSATPSAPTYSVTTVNASNYSASAANDYILLLNGGANRTVTLPTAIGNAGKKIDIKKLDAGNTLYIATVLNQTIDGVDATVTPLAITVQYEAVTLVSDGASWYVV